MVQPSMTAVGPIIPQTNRQLDRHPWGHLSRYSWFWSLGSDIWHPRLPSSAQLACVGKTTMLLQQMNLYRDPLGDLEGGVSLDQICTLQHPQTASSIPTNHFTLLTACTRFQQTCPSIQLWLHRFLIQKRSILTTLFTSKLRGR